MKEKLIRFMQGRYGMDALYRVLLLSGIACTVLSMLTSERAGVSSLFSLLSMGLLAWAVYRVFSRNIEKRYLENLHYLEWMGALRQRARINKEKFQQRKDYKFFVCPVCRTNLRVPKSKGKVNITCCKCGNRFQGKT